MTDRIDAAEAILATVSAAQQRMSVLAHTYLSFDRALALELLARVGTSPERLHNTYMHELIDRRLNLWRGIRGAPPSEAMPLSSVVLGSRLDPVDEESVDDAPTPVAAPLVIEREPREQPELPRLFAQEDAHAGADEWTESLNKPSAEDEEVEEQADQPDGEPVSLEHLVRFTAPPPDAEDLFSGGLEDGEDEATSETAEQTEEIADSPPVPMDNLVRFVEPSRLQAPHHDDAGVESPYDELDDELDDAIDDELLEEALADALGEDELSMHGGQPLSSLLSESEDDEDDEPYEADHPTEPGSLLDVLTPLSDSDLDEADDEDDDDPPSLPAASLQMITPAPVADEEPTWFAGPREISPRAMGSVDELGAPPPRRENRAATVQLGSRGRPDSSLEVSAPEAEDGERGGSGFSVTLERPSVYADDEVDEDASDPDSGGGPRLTDDDELSVAGTMTLPSDAAPAAPAPDAGLVAEFMRKAREAVDRADLNNGIMFYQDLLDVDPDNIEGFLGRGRCLVELGDYAAAMSDFQRAEDLDNRSPEPLVDMGNLYFAKKEYRRAIEFYDQAIEIDRNHAMAHCRRGICNHYRKNHDQAIKDLQRAQRLDPNIPNITKYVKMAVKASMQRPR